MIYWYIFSHGTEVAGLIAAEKDNNECIVGVAHQSTIVGKFGIPSYMYLISNNTLHGVPVFLNCLTCKTKFPVIASW